MLLIVLSMLTFTIATHAIDGLSTLVSAALGKVGITTVAERLVRDRNDALTAAKSARGERDTARRERDTARRERDVAHKDRDAARGERDTARRERDTARRERDVAQRTANSRRDIVRKQRRALKDTAARVSARIAAGAKRSVPASFGQSIPVVGAAVVAGVTAMELRDACDTMKDLAELEAALEAELLDDPELAGMTAPQEGVPGDGTAAAGARTTVCGISVPSAEELLLHAYQAPDEIWSALREHELDLPSWAEVVARISDLDLPAWPPDVDLPTLRGVIDTMRGWLGGAAGPPAPAGTQ
jgi:hypothetical protein